MKYLSLGLILLLGTLACFQAWDEFQPGQSLPLATNPNQTGFRAVDCWFEKGPGWPPVECYYMQVPERHGAPDSGHIRFPVIVFRAPPTTRTLAPVLHLGAGGPGAPMYLDNEVAVEDLWRLLGDLSIYRGRDLIVMDPRGTGLARPLLTCQQFVDNELLRFQENLTLEEEMRAIDADYHQCIDAFIAQGVDLAAYNSIAVARDVEAMRRAAGIDQWVLLGVSYAANYAITIASEYPDSIESMVLDSTLVLRVGLHQNYIETITGPYRQLFRYCDYDQECEQVIDDLEARFWALHQKLNANPLMIRMSHASQPGGITLALNGERFLAAVLEGVYDVEIFRDLPDIITELEAGEHSSIQPYLWLHVDYMLDRSYGDVSATAHFCYEERPFIDFERIKSLIEELPPGYLQDSARLMYDWPDYCERMQILETAAAVLPSQPIAIPTLFLHGRLDTITPLADVTTLRPFFENHQLLSFELSHSILSSSQCARERSAAFVENPLSPASRLRC
ncbi:MAG: alpha/beta fold hydrolase [Gammaproteobacteria bacterium]